MNLKSKMGMGLKKRGSSKGSKKRAKKESEKRTRKASNTTTTFKLPSALRLLHGFHLCQPE